MVSQFTVLASQFRTLIDDEMALIELRGNEPLREKLLDLTKALIPEIESQDDAAQRVLYTPLELTAARIGFDLNVFEKLTANPEPLRTEDIARGVGGDTDLIDRFLKLQRLLLEAEIGDNDPVFVDIGGGKGHHASDATAI